jgi:hypothetical protein|tara:strand:+ start:665 stop:808 length:144 start_codon:yes stop_codon:yes gene_type:complete
MMIHHHKYSLTELEDMLPWEREVYIGLLVKALEDEKKEHDRQERKNK